MSRQTLNHRARGTDNMIPVLATRYAPLQVFLRQYANQAREFVKSERASKLSAGARHAVRWWNLLEG